MGSQNRLAAICTLFFCCLAQGATTLMVYPVAPDHQSDGKITGTLDGTPAAFEYQHTYHPESAGQKDFHANYMRFAADGPVDVQLTVNAPISKAFLRTVGKDLPFARTASNLQFTLPGPGNYYLQLPDLNTAGRATYTVFFFFDDLNAYNSYQQAFATARNVTSYGVQPHPTQDQTAAVQAVLNGAGSICFPPGIYRTGQLSLKSNTTVYLAPGSVLKGVDGYNTSRYLYADGSQNLRIAGLGTVDANGFTAANLQTKGHLIDVEDAVNFRMDDVVLRNSNSWMVHLRKSDQVHIANVKLFSGKDGIDPDGSRDVLVEQAAIQSVDDGFAVKSKFQNRTCERLTVRDSIVFSCASALKIGTENYYGQVRDITWDRCDAVDADRGCILYTNASEGLAPISNVTWRNVRVFGFPWSVETGGAPFQFHNDSGVSISGLLLENILAWPTQSCSVRGPVGAVFRNVIVNGNSAIPAAGMSFQGVIWPGVVSQSRPVVFIGPAPRNQNGYNNGDDLTVTVQHPYGKAISQVQLYIDGQPGESRSAAPYQFRLAGLTAGEHVVTARAIDVDGAENTTAPQRIMFSTRPGVVGDFDFDRDVDQEDFGVFQRCLTGALMPVTDPDCLKARLDDDIDVDEGDTRIFLDCFFGPGVPPGPPCSP